MNNIFLFVLAIIPGIVISIWIYRQDRYQPEPVSLVIRAFICGCLSTVPAVIGQEFFQDLQNSQSLSDTALFSFGIIGVTEELSKFFMLRCFLYNEKDFDEPIDGIVYAVVIGMGFATLENVMYIFNVDELSGNALLTALGRGLTAVPAHATFGVLMGAYVGLAKFKPEKREFYMLIGVLLAIFFHGLYDIFLIQQVYEGMTVLSIIALIWGIRIALRLIKMEQEISRTEHEYPIEVLIADGFNAENYMPEAENDGRIQTDRHEENKNIEQHFDDEDVKNDTPDINKEENI